MKGVYLLIIWLGKEQKIKIGRLGRFNFKKGFYVYTGSALKNLEARVRRHRRKRKKLFWHIDYLLANKYAKIANVIGIQTRKRLECDVNKMVLSLPGAKVLVKGFGSSDCKCKSHLVYFGERDIRKLAEYNF